MSGTGENVGSGVKVGAEVGDSIGIGMAAAVCVEAELAVWAIIVPSVFGSSVAMGVIATGAQAKIKKRMIDQSKNFLPEIVMMPQGNCFQSAPNISC